MSTTMASGITTGDDTQKAVNAALDQALSQLGDKPVALSVVFAAAHYDFQVVVDEIRKRTASAPLIGCSSSGEFNEQRGEDKGLTLALISSDECKFFTALGKNLENDPAACLASAAEKLPKHVEGYPHLNAVLLHDGLVGKGEEAVMAATITLGPHISFAGGSAGDSLGFDKTYVFVDDEVARDCVGLCLVASKKSMSIGMNHGHKPFSDNLTTSRSEGSKLIEVDGKPAWEVWKEKLREKAKEIGLDVDNLSDNDVSKLLVRYELGLSTGDQYKVRVPLSKNDDGSLNFACTIPQGATFRIMESPVEDQIASARKAAQNALDGFEEDKIAGAIVFDCVCRGLILADRFYEAVNGMKEVLGDIPLVGFETYGEICKEKGQFSGFHNTSSVVLLLPK